MKLSSIVVPALCTLMFACGSSTSTTGSTGGGAGGGTGGAGGGAAANDFSTALKISAFIEGKRMTMEGANIPTHPNGFLQDVDFGASSQCYQKVVMNVAGGNFAVASDLGTIRGMDGGAPGVGMLGTCDRTVKAGMAAFTSTTALIENVKNNGECFDITLTFNGFSQEGRGSISADGKLVTLELFFGGQPANHRCADGNVGASGVLLKTVAFTGDAKQKYVVTTP